MIRERVRKRPQDTIRGHCVIVQQHTAYLTDKAAQMEAVQGVKYILYICV